MKYISKKTLAILGFLAAISFGFYFYFSTSTPSVAEEIKEYVVRKGTLQIDMEADGKSEVSNIRLKFKNNGVLKELLVQPGDEVIKGDVIARLDTRDFEYELASAKANYEAAVAKLSNTRNQNRSQSLTEQNKLNNARTQYEKDRQEYETMLKTPEAFSQQEIALKKLTQENSARNYELAKESYASVAVSSTDLEQASVAQAKASLDKAQKNLEDAALRAPADGVILALNSKVGETVSPNEDFAIISDGEGLEVKAQVLEMDIKDVSLGQAVEVEFESLPSQTFTGKVTYINKLPVNDPNGVVAYDVDIKLDKPDETIKSGSTCMVTFIVEQRKDVLVIPNEAVKIVSGKQVVEVKDGEEMSVREVKTGFTDGTNVEVKKGLQANDVIIIRKKSVAEKV